MNQEEHVSVARELIERADEESKNGGSELVAAEFLWGAFAHCLISVALNDGLPLDSHGAFQAIARHLDAVQGGSKWRSHFGSAEQLHEHFYHGDLSAGELRTHRQDTAQATGELLRML